YRLGLSSTVVAAGHRGRPGSAGTTAPAGRAPDRAGLRPAAHAEWPADAIVLRGRTGLGLVVPASPRPAAGGARPCLQRPDAAGLPDGRHPAFTGSERAVPGLTRRDESAGESVEEYLELVGQGRRKIVVLPVQVEAHARGMQEHPLQAHGAEPLVRRFVAVLGVAGQRVPGVLGMNADLV